MPATETETSILPDPADAASIDAVAPARADDLIASLADQQIDDLMADDGEADRDGDADAALSAAMDAASEVGEAASAIVTSAAGDLKAELDELEAARSTAIVEKGSEAEAVEAEPSPVTVAPSFDPSMKVAPAEAPPEPSAEVPATESRVTESPVIEPPPIEAPSMLPSGAEESSAAEVARELAADVAMLSTPLPSVVEHAASEAARDAWWKIAFRFIVSLPGLLLGAINLPVQPLSDRGREIIGAIGIVTLVNAAGLLIYLTMFARGH